MFSKAGVLKIFAKFIRKHLRPVAMLKRDPSSGLFPANSDNLLRTLLDFFQ